MTTASFDARFADAIKSIDLILKTSGMPLLERLQWTSEFGTLQAADSMARSGNVNTAEAMLTNLEKRIERKMGSA